jgi:hypothetical protein
MTPVAFTASDPGGSISGVQIVGNIQAGNNYTVRLNVKYSSQFQVAQVVFTANMWQLYGSVSCSVYASNSVSAYNDTNVNNVNAGLVPIYVNINNFPGCGVTTITAPFASLETYQYFHVFLVGVGGQDPAAAMQMFEAQGTLPGLILNTDYTVASDPSTGFPNITYTDATAITMTCMYERLAVEELNRRIYPVVRDASDLVLASASSAITGYTGWNVQNLSNALNFNYSGTNEMSLTSAGALTAANYKLSGTIYDSETVNIANPLYSSGTSITSFGTYIPYCRSFQSSGTMTINYQMPLKAANSQTKIFMLDVDTGSASDNTSWLQFSMTVVTTANYYTGGTICYSSLVQAVAGHAQLYFTTDLPVNSPLNSNFITISRLTGTSPTSGGTTLYSGTNVYLFGMNAIYLVNSIGSTSYTSKA